MIKGFNSDINARGKKYHVQSEDWGNTNPFLVTRIYLNGAVVKTLKTSHEDALRTSSINTAEGLKLALKKQHSETVELIMSGKLL